MMITPWDITIIQQHMELTAEEKRLEEEAKKPQNEQAEEADSSEDEKEEHKAEGGDGDA